MGAGLPVGTRSNAGTVVLLAAAGLALYVLARRRARRRKAIGESRD